MKKHHRELRQSNFEGGRMLFVIYTGVTTLHLSVTQIMY